MSRGLTRVSTIEGIERALHDFDVSPAEVFRRADLSQDILADPDALIPIEDIAQLLQAAREVTGEPGFILQMVALQDFSFAGLLGLLMQTAPDLAGALEEVPSYIHVLTHSVSYELEKGSESSLFALSIDDSYLTLEQREIVAELALASCYKLLKTLTNQRFSLRAVHFQASRNGDTTKVERFFQAPAVFSSEFEGLLFDNRYLAMPVIHSNNMLHKMVINQINRSTAITGSQDLVKSVRQLIRHQVLNGECTVTGVAAAIGCDKRTLQRRLKDQHGTTFQQLLVEIRLELAKLYLESSQMSVSELAYLLGYASPGNLTRSFRDAMGSTPRAWRLAHSQATQ